ncbi:hypothetical protein CLU79DRAFT_318362 [Phycomyces nitens]|nr:hypothetical protein CLU79DRAFT_318362 [Phycomyces nitens]
MADLYLQGLLIEDMEDANTKLETKVLQSTLPTTLVDMTRLVVKQTPLFPSYHQHQTQYLAHIDSKLDEELCLFASDQTRSSVPNTDSGWKRHNIFNRTEAIAPLVQTLLDETRKVPTRMREAYIQQWRHLLIRKALALIKWVEEEARCFPLVQSNSGGSSDAQMTKDIVTHLMDALELNNWTDFSIILTQAEKLKKGMVVFLSTYSKRL